MWVVAGSVRKVLKKLIHYAQGAEHTLTVTKRPVIRMGLQDGSYACGMFFGAGAIHSGILYCRQNLHTKGMRGELGPSVATLRFLVDWITVGKLVSPVKAKVNLEDNQQRDDVFTIITATVLHRLLMGIFPFWRGKPSTRQYALTLIKQYAPKPTRAFLNILRGKAPTVTDTQQHYYSTNTKLTRLTIYDGFTLDGELYGQAGVATEVTLEATKDVAFLTR